MRRIFVSGAREAAARGLADGAVAVRGPAFLGLAEGDRSAEAGLWARLCRRLAAWRTQAADAFLYLELSKLSDAELGRRGLARGDLHRPVAERHER
jgi:hypothetical protein